MFYAICCFPQKTSTWDLPPQNKIDCFLFCFFDLIENHGSSSDSLLIRSWIAMPKESKLLFPEFQNAPLLRGVGRCIAPCVGFFTRSTYTLWFTARKSMFEASKGDICVMFRPIASGTPDRLRSHIAKKKKKIRENLDFGREILFRSTETFCRDEFQKILVLIVALKFLQWNKRSNKMHQSNLGQLTDY